MRNVIGHFKNHVLCKYDLKGSTIDRKENFEIDEVNNIVMKDINFDEIEKYLLLNDMDIQKIHSIVSADAYFLTDMNIMDYSLFVVKLSLNAVEVNNLFIYFL